MKKIKQRVNHRSKRFNPSKFDTPEKPADSLGPVREVLGLLLLAIVVFLIYSNTMGCPFIFDDRHNIYNNPNIRLTRLSLEGIKRAVLESPSLNRPVANISFALNYYFHRYNVAGYHLVNILIHIAIGILLYYFSKTTLSIPSLRSRYGPYGWIPLFAASMWLVHPIQTQSVTYIVQRMNSMAAMFYVLSLFLYARARLAEGKRKKWALFAGCILSGILALGSKEITVTLPLFILLYEWYFFQDLNRSWLRGHVFFFLGILVLLSLVALVFLGVEPLETILSTYRTRDFTVTQRVMTQFRVVIYYISLLIFPHPSRLNLDYDFPLSHSLINPITTLSSIGAMVGLLVLVLYTAKKDRLISFCLLWFLGNLVLESSVIGLEMIFEHRTYLPSMLISLMAITLAYRIIRPERLRVAVLCATVMICSIWTYDRNRVWSDDVTLWRDCVEKSPKKARPRYNLGYALAEHGNLKEAISHYTEALRIEPDYAKAHNNLGHALARQGEIKEAIRHFSDALRIKPDYADPHFNLGIVLASQGNRMEAISHFSEALRVKPDYAEAHYNLGIVLASQGNLEEAVGHYTEALRINPDYAEAHYNLGIALASQGNLKEAIRHYSLALQAKPDFLKAHYNLGIVLTSQGNLEGAINHFLEALRINPGYAKAHNNLGNALKRQGKLREAVSHYTEALRINPDYAEAHYNLGIALASQGSLKAAIKHYSEALRISPDFQEARRNLERGLRLMEKSIEAPNTLIRP